MALDWDNIVIKTDEYSYSLDSEQRMIIFEGQPGSMGPSGGITIGSVETLPAGSSATVTNTGTFSSAILNFGIPKGDPGDNAVVWGAIVGTLSDQTDLDNALASKADTADLGAMASADDAPSDNKNYARKNGTWSEITGGGGGGSSAWGDITGTLSDQTDLQSELDMKIEDAPSDGAQYARKDGQWTVVTGGGGGGDAAWGGIVGTLSNQTDLQTALDAKPGEDDFAPDLPSSETISDGLYYNRSQSSYVFYRNGQLALAMPLKYVLSTIEALKLEDAPRDGSEYVRKNGQWSISSGGGGGSASWGGITGTLSNQTDLKNALDGKADASSVYSKTDSDALLLAKANTADLGGMATVNDAPSDNKNYARKNGAWAEVTDGGSSEWGNITGTLSDQTDLNTALSGKADASTVYTKTEADNLLSAKANTADLGDLAAEDDAPSDNTQYARKNGTWDQIATPAWGVISGTLANQTDLQSALNAKQDTLTFDNTPTSGSTNPVTSSGIKSAIDSKADSTAVYSKSETDNLLTAKANTADLGDMASVDDAPSDGKNYARKNGTWSEVTGGGGGGSGLPAGGTIGQVLAKRSDTDGDVGWYNLRHLPSDKWYLPNGILESDVIAAYQFVNRLDEAEALININDGVKYGLSKGSGVIWSSSSGFSIPSTNSLVALTNNDLLNANDSWCTFGLGYNLDSIDSRIVYGGIRSNTKAIYVRLYNGYSGIHNTSGGNVYRVSSSIQKSAVIMGEVSTTYKIFINGIEQSIASSSTDSRSVPNSIIGTWNNSNSTFNVTALVIYKVPLTVSQHLQLYDNIRALGGID